MDMSTRVLGGLCILFTMGSLRAKVNTKITFQCDMSVQIALGAFDPVSGQVVVRGELNGWACSEPMTDTDGDGVYEIVLPRDGLLPGTYPYKFNINCTDGGWEGGADRTYTATGAEPDTDADGYVEITTLRFFNDVLSPGNDTAILFQCDMSVQIDRGSFTPGSDTVQLRGELNAWACTEMTDDDGDEIYEVTVKAATAPGTYRYKFNVSCSDRWEGGNDRSYTVTGTEPDDDGDGFGDLTVTRFYDDISSATPTHDTELLLRCDMSVQIALGRFTPGLSTLQLRGEINAWACTEMTDDDGDEVYEVSIKIAELPEKTYAYKFNIDCGNTWEDGADRAYVVDGTAPDTNKDGFGEITVLRFFNDVSTEDVLFSDVTVIFSVNMLAVRRALDAHETITPVQEHGGPITDFSEITSVGVTGPWSGWNFTQFTAENLMVDDGTGFDEVAGDLIYTGSFVFLTGSSRDLVYKFSLNGYDNEGGVGNDHLVRVEGDGPEIRLPVDCYGSLNTDIRLPFGTVEGAFGCATNLFIRGDCNADGRPDISDAVFNLAFLFTGGQVPGCVEACNANADVKNDISDAVFLLGHLFLGGPAPPAPFPSCGAPATEGLGCGTPGC